MAVKYLLGYRSLCNHISNQIIHLQILFELLMRLIQADVNLLIEPFIELKFKLLKQIKFEHSTYLFL